MKRIALSLALISLLLTAPVSAQQSEPIEWPANARELKWAFVLSRMFAPEWVITTAQQDVEDREHEDREREDRGREDREHEDREREDREHEDREREDPGGSEGLGLDSIIHQIESVVVVGAYDSPPDPEDLLGAPASGTWASLSWDELYQSVTDDIDRLIDNSDLPVLYWDGVVLEGPMDLFEHEWTIGDHDEWFDDLRSDGKDGQESSDKGGDEKDDGDTKLPIGEFWFGHENRGTPEYTWDQVSAMSDAELRALGDSVVVPAYADWVLRGPNLHFFPFPSAQFTIEPAQEPIGDEWCASPYYVGATGLDVRGQTWAPSDRPTGLGPCVWGGTEQTAGILIMSGDHLADWVAQFAG